MTKLQQKTPLDMLGSFKGLEVFEIPKKNIRFISGTVVAFDLNDHISFENGHVVVEYGTTILKIGFKYLFQNKGEVIFFPDESDSEIKKILKKISEK